MEHAPVRKVLFSLRPKFNRAAKCGFLQCSLDPVQHEFRFQTPDCDRSPGKRAVQTSIGGWENS